MWARSHGFDNDHHVWDELAPELASYYRTLAMDHRGHGDSAWHPEGDYAPEVLLQDVEAVLKHLGIERLVLVGHSLGGRVAMRFAGAHPEMMAGLVVVDVGPDIDRRGVTRISMETQSAESSYPSVHQFEQVLATRYPVTHRDTVARLAKLWVREKDDGTFEPKTDPGFMLGRQKISVEEAHKWAERDSAELWKILEGISCPTLVVRGAASDIFDPETADRMAEVLPKGRLDVIARASHSVMLDNPAAFLTSIKGFVLGD